MQDHWACFGRNYYARHDYEGIEIDGAEALMAWLRERIPGLAGAEAGDLTVETADDFAYYDPVDGSDSRHQGIRILFGDGSRIVFRLSGTGTEGATLRVYIERYEPKDGQLVLETATALAPLIEAAEMIAKIAQHTGRTEPDVVT